MNGSVNGRKRETSSNGIDNGDFPNSPTSPGFRDGVHSSRSGSPVHGPVEDEYSEFTINEIINGTAAATSTTSSSTTPTSTKTNPLDTSSQTSTAAPSTSSTSSSASGDTSTTSESTFIGLIPLINNYLDSLNVDIETRCELNLYLDLVSKRASGELMTTATWIRRFIRNHPNYEFDSKVSKEINFDMMQKLDEIQDGRTEATGFLPKWYAKRQRGFDEVRR